MTTKATKDAPASPGEKPQCFVIMPISDQPGYAAGHFDRVYEDITKPAVEAAGYKPVRGDEVKHANLIHLDILQRILNAPMAICDLSAVNGNVMFELGLRQAFDKPVVLIKDSDTREIFDISPIRYVKYEAGLSYRAVISARAAIVETITVTRDANPGDGMNSIVGLLGLKAASLPHTTETPEDARFSLLEKNLSDIRNEIVGIRNISRDIALRELKYSQGYPRINDPDRDSYFADYVKRVSMARLHEILEDKGITENLFRIAAKERESRKQKRIDNISE